MRVGLNLVYLVPGKTGGMETYARHLIPAMCRLAPDREFVAFMNQEAFNEDFARSLGVRNAIRVPVRAHKRLQWVWGEQALLPSLVKRSQVDVLHNLAWSGPLRPPCPMVTTTHDVAYAHGLEPFWRLRTLGMRALLPRVARASDRVIAVSQFSAKDIVRVTGLEANRVRVVYEAADAVAPEGSVTPVVLRQRMSIGNRRVLICPAAKRPHKNLTRLIEALGLVPADQRPVLIIPGYSTSHEAFLRQRISDLSLSDHVRLLGWIPDNEMEGLYQLADAMVFPSLFEGFGLPILEAFQRSVPVACSRAASLPEIAGGAALLFDPYDQRDIASAIQQVTLNPALRSDLKAAGVVRAQTFTWNAAAAQTLEIYDAVASERRGSVDRRSP